MRKKSGIRFFTVLLFMSLLFFPGRVMADETCKVIAFTSTPGDEENRLSTEFFLMQNPGFNAVNLELEYDTSRLELLGMSAEDDDCLLKGAVINQEEGLLAFDSTDNIWEDGKLVTVYWKSLAENYETEIRLKIVALGNAEGTNITSVVTSEAVRLEKRAESFFADEEAVGVREINEEEKERIHSFEDGKEETIEETAAEVLLGTEVQTQEIEEAVSETDIQTEAQTNLVTAKETDAETAEETNRASIPWITVIILVLCAAGVIVGIRKIHRGAK